MKKSLIPIILLLFGFSLAFNQTFKSPPSPQYTIYDGDVIKPQEYKQRRTAVLAAMDSNSIAIFCANSPSRRNGDVDYRFRQNDNFLYLTGLNEVNATLILAPSGIQIDSALIAKEILFINGYTKSWEGSTLGVEGAKQILGFGAKGSNSAVVTTDSLENLLPRILDSINIVYYTPSLPDILFDPISKMAFSSVREVRKRLTDKYPHLAVRSSELLVNNLRAVKSSGELAFIQRSIDVTRSGFIEAIKRCRPGMYEYELQAIIEYCFIRGGCEFYGFPSIVGSGPNALAYHYDANRRQMNSGELVVMDIGAEYHGYSADVTRTIPVNGFYSPAQKEIYELVLRAQKSAIDEVKPGLAMNDPGRKALEILGDGLKRLGIIKDKSEVIRYCPHAISHFVGLDVHDVGSSEKLVPGMVFTIEPGLYFPDSSDYDREYRGIGIRIEDDILVTEDGCKVLSDAIPRTVEGIELLMNRKK